MTRAVAFDMRLRSEPQGTSADAQRDRKADKEHVSKQTSDEHQRGKGLLAGKGGKWNDNEVHDCIDAQAKNKA